MTTCLNIVDIEIDAILFGRFDVWKYEGIDLYETTGVFYDGKIELRERWEMREIMDYEKDIRVFREIIVVVRYWWTKHRENRLHDLIDEFVWKR